MQLRQVCAHVVIGACVKKHVLWFVIGLLLDQTPLTN